MKLTRNDKMYLKMYLPYLLKGKPHDKAAEDVQLYLYDRDICPVEWVLSQKVKQDD